MVDIDLQLLADAIGGDEMSSAIAAEDPYTAFMDIPATTAKQGILAAAKYPTNKNQVESIAVSAISGLLEGLLGSASRGNRSNALKLATEGVATGHRPAGMSDNIWNLTEALHTKSILSGAADRAERRLDRFDAFAIEKEKGKIQTARDLLKIGAENPQQLKDLERSGILGALLGNDPAPAKSAPVLAETQAVPATGGLVGSEPAPDVFDVPRGGVGSVDITPLRERTAEDADFFWERTGLPRKEAATMAKTREASELRIDEKSYDEVRDASRRAKELLNVADTSQMALDAGLETGSGAEFGQWLAKNRKYLLGAPAALGFDAERAAAGSTLESIQAKIMEYSRPPGVGAQSNMEAKLYLQSGPMLGKEVADNRMLIKRMRDVMGRDVAYGKFVDEVRAAGGTVADASKHWRKYEEAMPFMVPDGEGRLVPNPNIVSYEDFDFKSGKAVEGAKPATPELPPLASSDLNASVGPTVLGEFVQGGLETPQDLAALFKPSTYHSMVANPETGEIGADAGTVKQAARTAGAGASMIAGAVTGAAKGTPFFPPFGTAIGAGVGAGLGWLGWNTAEKAVEHAAGGNPEWTPGDIIPDREEIGQAAKIAGGSVLGGALLKGAKNATVGSVKRASNAARSTVDQARKASLSVQPKHLKRALDKGVTYYDEFDNELLYGDDLGNATQYKSQLTKSADNLAADGFFKNLPNDTGQVYLRLKQGLGTAGKKVGDVHKEIKARVRELWENSSSMKKAEYPLERKASGKGGYTEIDPTIGADGQVVRQFSKAWKVVEDIAEGDVQAGQTAAKYLQREIDSWNNSSRSYTKVLDKKRAYGKKSKFDKVQPEDPNITLVKQALHNTFNEVVNNTAKHVGLADELVDANKTFSAYKTFNRVVTEAGEMGRPDIVRGNILKDLWNLKGRVTEKYPSNVLRAGEAAERGINAVTRPVRGGIDSITMNGRLVPPAEAVGGAAAFADQYHEEESPSIFSPNTADAAGFYLDMPIDDEPVSKKKSEMRQAPPEIAQAIQDVAAELNADPVLMQAIVEQESNYNPKVKSSADAVGLMQLLPGTAKEQAEKMGIENYDLENPHDNLRLGWGYYNRMLDLFGGDVEKALTAYHSGPGNVIRGKLGPIGRKYAKQVLGRMETG